RWESAEGSWRCPEEGRRGDAAGGPTLRRLPGGQARCKFLDCLPARGGCFQPFIVFTKTAAGGASQVLPESQLLPLGGTTMLTLLGTAQRFCDGISRRNFLKVGAFGAGLTLAEMLRARALAAKASGKPTANKAAILIYLPGGPSHMDMYDLKPD